jgi:hypothetical protein
MSSPHAIRISKLHCLQNDVMTNPDAYGLFRMQLPEETKLLEEIKVPNGYCQYKITRGRNQDTDDIYCNLHQERLNQQKLQIKTNGDKPPSFGMNMRGYNDSFEIYTVKWGGACGSIKYKFLVKSKHDDHEIAFLGIVLGKGLSNYRLLSEREKIIVCNCGIIVE